MPIDFTPIDQDQGGAAPKIDFTPDEQPKLPDTSGIQKIVNDNISAQDKDNPPETPQQQIDTATGMPITAMLNGGAKDAPIPEPIRTDYTNSIKNGNAKSFGDYMQTALLVAGAVARHQYTGSWGGDKSTAVGAAARGAETSAVPTAGGFAAFKPGAIAGEKLASYVAPFAGEFAPFVIGGGALVGGILSSMGGSYATAAGQKKFLDAHPEIADKLGISNDQLQKDATQHPTASFAGGLIPNLALMQPGSASFKQIALGGALGAGQEAGRELSSEEKLDPEKIALSSIMTAISNKETALGSKISSGVESMISSGHDFLKTIIGDSIKIPPDSVTPDHTNQTILTNMDSRAPTEAHFSDTAKVMGVDVNTLHEIYNKTKTHPDQVFEDAKNNPELKAQVEAGVVPKEYAHLRTPVKSVDASESNLDAQNVTAEDIIEHAKNRLDSINAKANGSPDRQIVGEDGKPTTIRGETAQFLTHAEKMERDFLRDNLNNPEKLANAYGAKIGDANNSTTTNVVDHSQHVPEEFREFAKNGNYPPTVEGSHQAAKDFVVSKGQQTGNEHLVAIDENGRASHHTEGGKDYIDIPADLRDRLINIENKITIHHNHPENVGLSPIDISTLGASGADKIFAHSAEGHTFSASLTDEMKKYVSSGDDILHRNNLYDIADRAYAETLSQIRALVSKGEIEGGGPGSDSSKAHTEIFNKVLHRLGIIDYNSSEPVKGITQEQSEDIIAKTSEVIKRRLERYGYKELQERMDNQRTGPSGLFTASNERGNASTGEPLGRSGTGEMAQGSEEIKSAQGATEAINTASKLSSLIPQKVKDWANDIKRDILNFATPMETGSNRAAASAKDFANSIRWSQWNGSRLFNYLKDTYKPEDLKNMWNAMDESSVYVQQQEANGLSRADAMKVAEDNKVGHFSLPGDQQEIVKSMSDHSQSLWDQAKKLGMVEGEGLPFWTPRMAAVIGEDGHWQAPEGEKPSANNVKGISTTSPNLMHREHLTAAETEAGQKGALGEKYGEENVQLVRDIRTMPMAMSRLEQAIAGRTLIDQIKKMSTAVGGETTSDHPQEGFFTLDHPAFQKYAPRLKLGEGKEGNQWFQVHDQDGNPIFDKQPIYVSKEFEGPLKAVLSQDSGAAYKALMDLKGKAMSMIMYSPLIHNAVEWGRALPAMPGKVATFKIYFEGNEFKNDPVQMKEAINAGMVPIGSRYFNQDISSIMEDPSLTPGRSWTAKLLGGLAGKVNEAAGEKVKSTIDKLGDIWHNTLLWDRVGDLQAGLYKNIRDAEVARGTDPTAAAAIAAHMANRFAGALPKESMGGMARKIANVALFSRSFTIGNLGVMKDMIAGLPSDVKAQLERDIGQEGASAASKSVQRKAIGAFAIDIALMYAGNSLMQDTFDALKRDKTLGNIAQGYVDRFKKLMSDHAGSPWDLLNLPADMQALSSTSSNEPGKENRIHFSDDPKTGTAYYMRMPTGKIGEEFEGWLTSPLDMLRKKESTLVAPVLDVYNNRDYFGHPVYDKNAAGLSGAAENLGKVVLHLMGAQAPVESAVSAYKTLTGSGSSLDAMKAIGPLAGVTFSKGYPGGPVAGIQAEANRRNEKEIEDALPNVKKAVEDGDTSKAIEMLSNLGMTSRQAGRIIKGYQNPASRVNERSLGKFERIATPEEKELMEEQSQPTSQQ